MPLPSLLDQADRLLAAGLVPAEGSGLEGGSGLDATVLRGAATRLAADAPTGSLLVVHERHLPPSSIAPHLVREVRTRSGVERRPGFVVTDMADVDAFDPVPGTGVPDADVYAVPGLERGDDMANWSPAEAAAEITGRGRTPLTLAEGLHWVLQDPDVLTKNACFMTIASRLPKPGGSFDARTPAIWISGGTGRDGSERRGAAKVGWCWWNNRHTWLGFASADGRLAS